MRSLFVSILIATFIIVSCGAFAFPTSELLATLSRAAITLVLFASFSVAILLLPDKPSRRQAFIVGSLLPVFCIVFGNVEIFKILSELYHALFKLFFGISERKTAGLFAGTVLVALANGLLTFVFFESFRPDGKQGSDTNS